MQQLKTSERHQGITVWQYSSAEALSLNQPEIVVPVGRESMRY